MTRDYPRLTNRLDTWSNRYVRLANATTDADPTRDRATVLVVTLTLDERVDVDLVTRRVSATLTGLDGEVDRELNPPDRVEPAAPSAG